MKNKTTQKSSTKTLTLFEKLELSLNERNKIISIILPILTLLFCIGMFDAKISIGHDDALYIKAGYNYAKDFWGYYYVDNAPLYVMFLALPIKIFGVNLLVLKLINIIFFTLSIYFIYIALSNLLPKLVLIPSIVIFTTNWFALTYASLTYTEAFFLLIQSVFFIFYSKRIDTENSDKINIPKELFFGFLTFLLFFTKTVGLGAIIAIFVFYLISKKFKIAIISVISFSVVTLIFEAIKRILWGQKVSQFSQTNILYLKDAYDPSKGTEDINGFIVRFFENSVIYISGRFWEILGFKEENSNFSIPLTILTVTLILIGLYSAFIRKQKIVLAISLYFIVLLSITFIVLQTSWGQGRLIMVYLPLILITIFYGIYSKLDSVKNSGFQLLYIVFVGVFLFVNLKTTLGKVSKNISIVNRNLIKNDKYAGYTDDYKNFLMLSEYCHDSLPAGSYVASRKAPMSFVYGKGMEFFPIYKANGPSNADSVLNYLKKQKVTHVIFANLRLNPKISGDVFSPPNPGLPDIYRAYQDQDKKAIVNTIHNFMSPIAQQYPEKFKLVKIQGIDEEAILYKIEY